MDPRILRTRRAILCAATELLRTQKVSELTVASICAGAGVSRVAFYDRFGTLDAMFGALMEEELTQVRSLAASLQRLDGRGNDAPPEDLIELFRIVGENAELYRAMLDEGGNLAFVHQMREALRTAIRATLHRLPDTSTWSIDVEIYLDYAAGAVLSSIIGWLRRDPRPSNHEMAEQIWLLIPRQFDFHT